MPPVNAPWAKIVGIGWAIHGFWIVMWGDLLDATEVTLGFLGFPLTVWICWRFAQDEYPA